ncbi:tetratricopeptide repeat protein 23-like [Tiliqua scincoides]|uniref:tetratricopeptide repeat protein 23-like n=1 Tax=Tiliqua scincoides TaxID=71010 RepID=UPI003462F6E6
MSHSCEEKEITSELFATPETKLMQALKRAERFAEEKEAHKAQRELIQCTALTRIIYGNRHWKLAQALANLAHSYLVLQGLPVQTMQHANSAKCIIFSGGSTPPASSEERREILSTLVTIYYSLGVAHLKQKNSKKSYCSLRKAKSIMEELQELDWSRTPELKVSEKDLNAALGRACLQQNKMELAIRHFKKAINAVISSEGEMAPELINLYKKIAQTEQVKKNNEKSIEYLLHAYSIALAVHKKSSTEAASIALLLGKAYAATGEEQYSEVAETYFSESLAAYKVALGMDHPLTIDALKDFSKWLICAGKREHAYNLLKESFQLHLDPCSDFNEKAAERFYIMGCICLSEGKMKEAYQLFSKCVQIQVIVYGSQYRKTKDIQKLLDVLKKSPAVLEGIRHMKPKGEEVLTPS